MPFELTPLLSIQRSTISQSGKLHNVDSTAINFAEVTSKPLGEVEQTSCRLIIPFKLSTLLSSQNDPILQSGKPHNVDTTIINFGQLTSEPFGDVERITSCRTWPKRNTCPYCMTDVTHFSRHLERTHKEEGAVKQLMSLDSKDVTLKNLIKLIRRQGNLKKSEYLNSIKPVRRPTLNSNVCKRDYIVCQFCFGYYKRTYLRRHRSHCGLRTKEKIEGERENHLTDSQIFTICEGSNKGFYDSLRLKEEVFSIMRNDETSQAAMNDILMRSYAEGLLKKHKRIQIKNAISNKMRELGRLLLQLKQLTGIKTLFEAITPEFFDQIVTATKLISGYNTHSNTFEASSLAIHMGNTLKQVCDTAAKLIIKKSRFIPQEGCEINLKNIKRMKSLIVNHWTSEISSLALKDLNEKRWEKPKILPLTSDILLFEKYVTAEIKQTKTNLEKGNSSDKQYRRLCENVMALVLLLNRKRIGEVQYLNVKTYCSQEDKNNPQEELFASLSERERILTKSFKRVVAGGKGSKPVPILFSERMQHMVTCILEFRYKYVPHTNEYHFANQKTANRWLSGYHVLKKLAKQAEVKHKELFTSTRLRKQIACILRVLNIIDTEMEQFANFMGHTKKTHEEYYRLPQDVYQTAKVSKLLLAVNNGKISELKGKRLEEIEFSDDVDSEASASDAEETTIKSFQLKDKSYCKITTKTTAGSSQNKIARKHNDPNFASKSAITDNTVRPKQRKKQNREKWTEEQKILIRTHFKKHIQNKISPKKHEVEDFIQVYKSNFSGRKWVLIKAYVYNSYKT